METDELVQALMMVPKTHLRLIELAWEVAAERQSDWGVAEQAYLQRQLVGRFHVADCHLGSAPGQELGQSHVSASAEPD